MDPESFQSASSNGASIEIAARQTIQPGHTVIMRLPSGELRSVKLDSKSNVNLGKFGNFTASLLFGQPYGLSYEITEKALEVIPPAAFVDIEDTDATNEFINDSQTQPMTHEEVEALKESGTHVEDIIEIQISQHPNFLKKTEYSKDKYRKRKEAKFSKYFSTLEPTIHNVCDYWYSRDQSRVRDIRPDGLAQMMALGNVRPGGRYLVVDDASGIVLCAVLDRIGGEGKVIALCDVESQPVYHIMEYMNFDHEVIQKVFTFLNWAMAEETYNPVAPDPLSSPTSESINTRTERQQARLNKRRATAEALSQVRSELFAGGFDGLLIASQYDPLSIIEALTPYLAGSGSIVVHNPHIQPLCEAQVAMRADPRFLSPSITEPWLRKYQVLPGRTHPFMNIAGSSGYILHAIRVFGDTVDYDSSADRKQRYTCR